MELRIPSGRAGRHKLWGGRPRLQPAPWPACPVVERIDPSNESAGPGGPARSCPEGARSAPPNRCRVGYLSQAGFTFVELMVVLTITVILISMAIPIYQRSILRAKESVLHNNLFTLRTVIDNYTYDKQKAPQTLEALVSDGYLREIPLDPITGSNQTWRTILEDASQSVNQSEPGIFDVRSGSDAVGLNGIPYSEW
jgi:general secretion pathway protein G